MRRVAAIDCGTNSIRLLIADSDNGQLRDVVREMRVVRLGQGVDATGGFAPQALERTFRACEEYAQLIAEAGAEQVRFVATSATRDAHNREEFFTGVRERLCVNPEVISGQEEAELSFRGAVSGLGVRGGGPNLVMDLGGGSTELVVGGTTVDAAFSMDIGCVRMTERHMHSDPPTAAEIDHAIADVDQWYEQARSTVPVGGARRFVGVAGTITTVAAAALNLDRYDSTAIHGARFELADIVKACDYLTGLSRDERAALPFMHPGRVDVIGAGAQVFKRVLTRIDADVRAAGGELEICVSETDILDGIALSQLVQIVR